MTRRNDRYWMAPEVILCNPDVSGYYAGGGDGLEEGEGEAADGYGSRSRAVVPYGTACDLWYGYEVV